MLDARADRPGVLPTGTSARTAWSSFPTRRRKRCRTWTGGGVFFDVVFDATGSAAAMQQGFAYVAHGGTYVLISVVSADITFSDPEFHKRETSLLASRNATIDDFDYVLSAIKAGQVPTAALNTHQAALKDLSEALPGWLEPSAGVIKRHRRVLIDAHCHVWRTRREHDHAWPTPDLDADPPELRPDRIWPRRRGCPVPSLARFWRSPSPASATPNRRCWRWQPTPLALGVVGWTDAAAPDAAVRIAALAKNPLLKGLRPMLQDLADDWILDPAVEPAIAAMIAADLSFDALIKPRHLPATLELIRRWPDLRVVIDHGAKPEIAARRLDPWRDHVAALAAQPSVHCKLSGLLTEAGGTPTADAVAPFAAHLIEAFGPDRLMWGSDWPVLNLASDYGVWRAIRARPGSSQNTRRRYSARRRGDLYRL
ncbi:amidohydrolase family protein [Caulobacter segnis]